MKGIPTGTALTPSHLDRIKHSRPSSGQSICSTRSGGTVPTSRRKPSITRSDRRLSQRRVAWPVIDRSVSFRQAIEAVGEDLVRRTYVEALSPFRNRTAPTARTTCSGTSSRTSRPSDSPVVVTKAVGAEARVNLVQGQCHTTGAVPPARADAALPAMVRPSRLILWACRRGRCCRRGGAASSVRRAPPHVHRHPLRRVQGRSSAPAELARVAVVAGWNDGRMSTDLPQAAYIGP